MAAHALSHSQLPKTADFVRTRVKNASLDMKPPSLRTPTLEIKLVRENN